MTRQRRKRTLHCAPSYLGLVVKLIEARLKITISCVVIDDLTTFVEGCFVSTSSKLTSAFLRASSSGLRPKA